MSDAAYFAVVFCVTFQLVMLLGGFVIYLIGKQLDRRARAKLPDTKLPRATLRK
jgi:hypothetical protein